MEEKLLHLTSYEGLVIEDQSLFGWLKDGYTFSPLGI